MNCLLLSLRTSQCSIFDSKPFHPPGHIYGYIWPWTLISGVQGLRAFWNLPQMLVSQQITLCHFCSLSVFKSLLHLFVSVCVLTWTHTHIPQCVHTRFFLPPSVPSLNSGLGARAFTLWVILRTLLLQFFHIKLQIYVLSSTRQSIHRERGGETHTHTERENISFHHKELSVVLESVNIRLRKNNKNKSSL